jgi:hypothetical protein
MDERIYGSTPLTILSEVEGMSKVEGKTTEK